MKNSEKNIKMFIRTKIRIDGMKMHTKIEKFRKNH